MELRSFPVSTGTTPFMCLSTSSANSLTAASVMPASRSAALCSFRLAAERPRARTLSSATRPLLPHLQSEHSEQGPRCGRFPALGSDRVGRVLECLAGTDRLLRLSGLLIVHGGYSCSLWMNSTSARRYVPGVEGPTTFITRYRAVPRRYS